MKVHSRRFRRGCSLHSDICLFFFFLQHNIFINIKDYLIIFSRLKNVQTTEELKDVHSHFLMYYAQDVKKMLEVVRAKEREAAKERARQEKKVNGRGKRANQ